MFDWEDFTAGWIAGIAGVLIGHPMDTIKTRQQALNKAALPAIKATFKNEGIRGFYKGMLSPLLSIGPINSLFFGVYGNVLHFLQNNSGEGERVLQNDPNWRKNVFLAGCVGGFVQCFVVCPVELIKTELQLKMGNKGKSSEWSPHYENPHKTPWAVVKHILKNNGVLGIYRGFVPTLWRDMISSMLYMPIYENYLVYNETSSMYHVAIAGGLTGMISWIFVIPFDVIKSRMQADNPSNPKFKGMMDCIVKSYQEGGRTIFVKGFAVCMLRAFPVNAAIFFTYEVVNKFIFRYLK